MIGILVCLFDQPITLVPAQFDYAMYEKKRNGRNGIYIYDGKLQAEYLRQLRLKGRLIKAISEYKLQVYYQPIIDIETD